jgi:hypothetical protein
MCYTTHGFFSHRCDEIKLDGTRKPPTEKRGSYVYAQKMRASMTYAFGRIQGLGSQSWQKSEVSGKMIGNPSVSESVATYMMSLRNRKVCVHIDHTKLFFLFFLVLRFTLVKLQPVPGQ